MKKINNKQIEQMKQLRESGKSYKDISIVFNVFPNTIRYHLSEDFRIKLKIYNRERYRNMNQEDKEKLYNKIREYQKEYHKKKYNGDEKFREKHLKRAREYQRKKYVKKEERK
jgi:hypothetical protein